MVVYYLDTSAILKRYKTETGTPSVDYLYDRADGFLVSSHFSCLEAEAAMARALKGQVVTQEGYDAFIGGFASEIGSRLYVLPMTGSLINESIAAARRYSLRAADGIQIASAREGKGHWPLRIRGERQGTPRRGDRRGNGHVRP